VIWEFGEVESGTLEFNSSTTLVTRVMRQLDGAQTGLGTMFKKKLLKDVTDV
jgi:hypothetical protein